MKVQLTSPGTKIRHSGVFYWDTTYGNDATGQIDNPAKPFATFAGIANWINSNPLSTNANGQGATYYDIIIKIYNAREYNIIIDTGLISANNINSFYSLIIDNVTGSPWYFDLIIRHLPSVIQINADVLRNLNIYWVHDDTIHSRSSWSPYTLIVNVNKLENFYEQIGVNLSNSNLNIRTIKTNIKKATSSYVYILQSPASGPLRIDNIYEDCNIEAEDVRWDNGGSSGSVSLNNIYKSCRFDITASHYFRSTGVMNGSVYDHFEDCSIYLSDRNFLANLYSTNNLSDITAWLNGTDPNMMIEIHERYANCSHFDLPGGVFYFSRRYGVCNSLVVENSTIHCYPKVIRDGILHVKQSNITFSIDSTSKDKLTLFCHSVSGSDVNISHSSFQSNGNSFILFNTANALIDNTLFKNVCVYFNANSFSYGYLKLDSNMFDISDLSWTHTNMPALTIGIFKMDSIFSSTAFPDVNTLITSGVLIQTIPNSIDINNIDIRHNTFYVNFDTTYLSGSVIKVSYNDSAAPTSITGSLNLLNNTFRLLNATTNNYLINGELQLTRLPVYHSENNYRESIWSWNNVLHYGEDRDVIYTNNLSSYTIQAHQKTIINTANSASISLPLLSSVAEGKVFIISTNTATVINVSPLGSDLINGLTGSITVSANSVVKFKALKSAGTYIIV
jgi:hypothetical protein